MRLSALRDSLHTLLRKPRTGFLSRFFAKRSDMDALQKWNEQMLQVVEDQQATLDAFNATLVEHEKRTVGHIEQIARLQEGLAAWEELRQPLRVLGAQVGALTAHATAVQSELHRLTGLAAQTNAALDAHRDQVARAGQEIQAHRERDRAELSQRLEREAAEAAASLGQIAGQLNLRLDELQEARTKFGDQLARQGADHAALAAALGNSVEVSRSHMTRAEATLAQLASQLGRINANVELEFAQFQHERSRVEERLSRQSADHSHLAQELKATAEFSRNLAAHADASVLRMTQEMGKMVAARDEVETLRQTVAQTLTPQMEETRSRVREIDAGLQSQEVRVTKLYRERGPDDPELFARFYLAFENQFRGTAEEITAKTLPYIPSVKKVIAAAAGAKSWIDLGCGRGEWLAQLVALGLEPVGVDTNQSMLQVCRERGLKVIEADALEYVQQLPADSVLGISAFHLIEHLPYRTLLALMSAVWRAIKPGGCLILETPNPQNVSVGACNFYMDLTHQKPIPPMTAEFLVRHAGFREVRVMRLNPFEARHAQRDSLPTITEREYCEMFYGPRDYGIVAIK
jgi:O-antigen chain-terminating methyltransferase